MQEETIKVVVTLKKKDLPAFIDKFGIEEYHYKKNEITIDMTNLFDDASAALPAKVAEKIAEPVSDVF